MRVDVVRAIAILLLPLAGFLAAIGSGGSGSAIAAGLTTFHITVINTTSPETGITRGAYLIHQAPGAFWSPGAPGEPRAGGHRRVRVATGRSGAAEHDRA